jgi:hypothetical protein
MELGKLLEAIASFKVEQIVAFAALVVPGFISLRVYEKLVGGEGRKANEVLIDVVVYSFATDLIALGTSAIVDAVVPAGAREATKRALAPAGFIGVPVLVAFLWYELNRRMVAAGVVPDPQLKPWDKVFERIARQRLNLGAILTLRDGRLVGGRLSYPAYASSYPAPEQLMLGEIWQIDQENRSFVAPVGGSWGMLIDKADCETIEFVDWLVVEAPYVKAARGESGGTG